MEKKLIKNLRPQEEVGSFDVLIRASASASEQDFVMSVNIFRGPSGGFKLSYVNDFDDQITLPPFKEAIKLAIKAETQNSKTSLIFGYNDDIHEGMTYTSLVKYIHFLEKKGIIISLDFNTPYELLP